MVSDKLPKELESKRWMVQYLQKVVSKPDMSQAELRELEDTIRENNIEINQLTEKRMMRNDPMDDKLSLQAAGENSQARDLEGDEVIRGDEFKRFVGNLCSKGAVFKKKRQEIRSEYGVLQRTEEILKQRSANSNCDPWRHRSGSLGTVTLRRNWRGCRPSRVN
uniref:Uncharacterized protein n=1 Tax=Hucho hucho TaxID=62062 RepID=A0A4W5QNG9_9TELE